MKEYKLYVLNDSNHIFCPAQRVSAFDDEGAIGAAHSLANRHAVEIWEGARLVACLKPPTSLAGRAAPTVAAHPALAFADLAAIPLTVSAG